MEVKNYYQKNKIFYIDIENISFDEFLETNTFSEEEIISSAAKIKKFGCLSPLCLRKNINKKGHFLLFFDPLYLLALKFLSVKTVPAIIYSFTLPEAVIFYLLKGETDIFKRAELLKFLLKTGNYTKKEVCDIFKISPLKLEHFLTPLCLTKRERELFTLKKFSLNFLLLFLKATEKEREETLNLILAENLTEEKATEFINSKKIKKEKPLKAAYLKNDTVIMNSLNRLSKNLESFGIFSIVEKTEKEEINEYKLTLLSSPNQLCFDFETNS